MSFTVILPLLPAVAAVVLVVLRDRRRALGAVAVTALGATLAVALLAPLPPVSLRWSSGLGLLLAPDGFGRVMVVLVPLVATPIVAYAAATETDGRTRLLALMTAFVAAMLVLVSAGDFLTLLIGWELVGALSWALIGHGWRDPENPRAGAQAFVTTRLGDLGLYVAAGATFAASGSFDFAGVASATGPERDIIAGGVLLAAAAKSAQIPFSPWLFAAMAGPTPVSALLHSATLVAAGAYLLIRLAPVLEPVAWFLPAVAIVGIVTALAGGIVATAQTQAKRVLAASTSAQYGLMFAAVGAGFPAAAAAHLVIHAAFKSLLFLGAGVAIHARGTGYLGRLRLGRELPRVATLSAIGALALAAVPPLSGAWSKEQIVAASFDASTWLGVGVLGAGFLSAVYAARYQILVYGRGRSEDGRSRPARLATVAETAGLAMLAAITLGLSLLWLPGAAALVEELAPGRLPEPGIVDTLAGLALIAAAFVLVVALHRANRLLTLGLPAAWEAGAADWLGLPRLTSAAVVRPATGLAARLARFDDRVVDAGVRAAAALAAAVSRLLSRRFEFAIDGVVRRVADATILTAAGSRVADDAGVDAAVELTARQVGLAGHQSRRLQTGQSHQYFVIVAAGLGAIVVILVAFR